jgi:hypothetical protein
MPDYYRKYYRVYLRFAVVMMIVALLMGILFQESSKKAPFSAALPPGVHLESVISLALVHGHTFLIGVLIPLAVTWMLYLGLMLGYQPISEKSLTIGTRLYLPASVGAVALMLYKGYHFLLGVRSGQMDFNALNESLFFGSHAARAAVYGLIHTALAVGLGILVISFWRTIRKTSA